jgi:hypothetical protein
VQDSHRNPIADTDPEYRAIEATLLATARGRWFLAEHGRRARRLDSALLEDALGRLRSSLKEPTALLDQFNAQLGDVRGLIAEVQAALARRPVAHRGGTGTAPQPSHPQGILFAAEQLHEFAWTLQGREGRDFDHSTCEQIARQAAAIYALSRAQAGDTEYTLELLAKLAAADDRIGSLLDSLEHEMAGKPLPPQTADSAADQPAD